MPRIITDSLEDQEWWRQRRRIGSSDASAIMGVDINDVPVKLAAEIKIYISIGVSNAI